MSEPQTPQTLPELYASLALCFGPDRPVLRKRLRGLEQRIRRGQPVERGLQDVQRAIAASRGKVEQRERSRPDLTYPDELPVVARREEIAAAIAQHQVVIVCGATGSGKSTQLPKICLELGRGSRGLIGHTQPRRIAARTLAERISAELGSELGGAVGYKIRFSDQVGPDSYIKLVTDGMLLAEIQGDRELAGYDTLIIDEAHERSLNIDFLLGYLRQLLPRRPDLKVIITSATIDPERFAAHFGGAPIIEVSGRSYPVEMRYRPLEGGDDDERGQRSAIIDAVDELAREGPGDVLVFLSGEREIRETAEALRKHHPPGTEILPLYARLSSAEQARAFSPGRGRRVVLATNVAETSVTVPGIRYVVDTGLARISRYSYRTKVQRLPIEPIAQASANQRAGRCGRLGPGVCVRLYSEEDFLARPEFAEPEIQRTNLASVILQMKALRLGDIENFPFIDPPDRRYVNDGYKLLHELGAVDADRRMTELGRQLARLPVDPRVARILLGGQAEGALRETLVLAAALSVQDPRERPLEAQQAADQAQQPFRDEQSDFFGHLKLWDAYREAAHSLSRRKLTAWCRERFLSPARMREWSDIHRQLRELVKAGGARENDEPAEYGQLHRALLTGFLSNVAFNNEGEYVGPRNLKLAIFPGSGLFKRRPKWIMAAELVETRRVYARDVAEVKPEWIEHLARHLLHRNYFEPHWDRRRARVSAFESTSLYGLVLTARRKVDFGPVDPVLAREIFIREGLVAGAYRSGGRFAAHNERLIEEIEALEAKSRRRDVLVDEELRVAFYAARIPADVYSGAGFERWRGKAERADPKLLFMRREDLMQHAAAAVTGTEFPDRVRVAGMELPLEYHFEPGHPLDGVVVVVPLAALNQLTPEPFDWLVPGLRSEKAVALIKALPKALRRNFVPAPDFASAALQAAEPGELSLREALRRELKRMTGIEIPLDAWDELELPAHLEAGFRVIGSDGETLASGKGLEVLQKELSGAASRDFERSRAPEWEREGLKRWDFDALPESVAFEQSGVRLRGYPALVDERQSVRLCLSDSPEEAQAQTRAGARRLFMLALPQQTKELRRKLPHRQALCLYFRSVGGCEELVEDLLAAGFERCFMPMGQFPRSRDAFEQRLAEGRARVVETVEDLCDKTLTVLEKFHELQKRLKAGARLTDVDSRQDLAQQLEYLVYPGFVTATPPEWYAHLPRYLEAMLRRLEKLSRDPGRDRSLLRTLRPLWEQYLARAELHRRKRLDDPALREYRWLLEEFRVSLFAQELRTAVPVSEKRLRQQWQAVA